MKKTLKAIATILLLCGLVFLGGEWPENTPKQQVIKCDGIALATVALCGFYLKKTWKDE